MRIACLLWSLIAWPLAFLLMLLVVLISLPFLPFVPFTRIQMGLPSRLMTWVLRLTTLSALEIIYHPRFDRKRPSVFCFNHTSMLDAHVAVTTVPHPICGMMNAWQLKVPVYGWIMRMANAIPVHPVRQGRFAELAAHVKDRGARGISIIVFPEAHRTLDGKIRPFKRGGFFMARDAGMPVVPVAVRGLYDVFPKGSWIFRPGRISIYVGPQVETTGMTDDQINDLSRRFQHFVAAYVERGEALTDPAVVPAAAAAAVAATGSGPQAALDPATPG